MYYYIFDVYTKEPKYQRDVDRIHLKLADLGIDGEKAQATPIRRVSDLAVSAIKSGQENIIAVGNDNTAHQVLNIIAREGADINFGFIPLGASRIAEVLGMPQAAAACFFISRKRMEKVDLGKVGKEYFLTSLEIKGEGKGGGILAKLKKSGTLRCEFKCDKDYKVTTEVASLAVVNIMDSELKKKFSDRINYKSINPYDGTLNVISWTSEQGDDSKGGFPLALSFFPAKDVDIAENKEAKCVLDGIGLEKVPPKVTVVRDKLGVIVGPKRTF